jgi:hypothetical protein
MEKKVKCSNCPETREIEFHKNKARSNGFNNRCKSCTKALKKPYLTNLETRRAYKRNYTKAHPERAKASRQRYWAKHKDELKLKRKLKGPPKILNHGLTYNHAWSLKQVMITPQEYITQLQKQEYRCGICGRHKTEFKKALAGDHDHITGKFRGVLCGNCNKALGLFMDNPEILKKAILYLGAILEA